MNDPITFLDFLAVSAVSARALSFAVWSAKAIVKLISSQTAATAPYTI